MRAIWKGAISFGLVTVPVRVYSATESHDVPLHQVRESDGSRIRYKRVAEADGSEVAYQDITRGYAAPDGRTVILTEDDLATLVTRGGKEIAVEKFVPAAQIDPLLLDSAYYLEPDKVAAKPYALLREALRSSDRMAVVSVTMRTRMSMAVLRVRGEAIVLQTMLWPDEVREPEFAVLDDIPEPSAAEVAMAHLLVDSMAGDFDPADYEDEYRVNLEALVQAKLAGGQVTQAPAAPDEAGQVVDLLAALQRSVERAQAARGEETAAAADDSAAGAPSASPAATSAPEAEAKPARRSPRRKDKAG